MFIPQLPEKGRIMNIGIPLPFDILLIIQDYLNRLMERRVIALDSYKGFFQRSNRLVEIILSHHLDTHIPGRYQLADGIIEAYYYGHSLDVKDQVQFFGTVFAKKAGRLRYYY